MSGTWERAATYAADGLTFTARAGDPADQALLDSVFHDMRSTGEARPGLPEYVLARVAGPAWAVEGPRVDRFVTPELGDAIARMFAGLSIAVLDASPEHLHLHAAAAVSEGRAVVIPATRYTGKTTTVANLLAAGWEFITDEIVTLDQPGRVSGVPRPLGLKPGAAEHISLPLDVVVPTSPTTGFRYASVGRNGGLVCAHAPVGTVALLEFPNDPNEAARVERLHPADAVVALMQHTLDAARYGPEAVVRLAELTCGAISARVFRGSPEGTVAAIAELAARPAPEPLVVERYGPSPNAGSAVVSLSLGGRAVIHHLGSGAILALDEAATKVWEVAGGWAGHADVDLSAPVISTFVGQLRDLDLLAETARG
jgi:hypothetical protein